MLAIRGHQQPEKATLVVGLGLTGYSIIRHLADSGIRLVAADTRELPPYLARVRSEYPSTEIVTGGVPTDCLERFSEVVVSPGVSIPGIRHDGRISLVGDVELFARQAAAPVIGVTGTNGKSTVTMLVERMLNAAGRTVRAAGNIGTPVLDMLALEAPEFYVLELSSFQLETTHSLAPVCAAFLNVSEDHMDRYAGIEEYARVKLRILERAESKIVNRDDDWIRAASESLAGVTGFGLQAPSADGDFGLLGEVGRRRLVAGTRELALETDILLKGDQNLANILAALALVEAAGITLSATVVEAACTFGGLPHRCETVADRGGVRWINDSKGTNVGATSAAIRGIREPVILIAGGRGKGADFRPLARRISDSVSHTILIGEDAGRISRVLPAEAGRTLVDSLEEAVALAHRLSEPGQVVLFSPACASFDMFDSYEHRGDAFRRLVQETVT